MSIAVFKTNQCGFRKHLCFQSVKSTRKIERCHWLHYSIHASFCIYNVIQLQCQAKPHHPDPILAEATLWTIATFQRPLIGSVEPQASFGRRSEELVLRNTHWGKLVISSIENYRWPSPKTYTVHWIMMHYVY